MCGNPAKSRKIIRSVISTENSIIPDEVVMQNSLPTKKPKEICDAVFKHFANIGVDFSSRIVSSDDDPPLGFFMKTPIDISMYMKPFSRDEVEKIIFGTKNTSAGSDSFNLLVLTRAKSSYGTCDEVGRAESSYGTRSEEPRAHLDEVGRAKSQELIWHL